MRHLLLTLALVLAALPARAAQLRANDCEATGCTADSVATVAGSVACDATTTCGDVSATPPSGAHYLCIDATSADGEARLDLNLGDRTEAWFTFRIWIDPTPTATADVFTVTDAAGADSLAVEIQSSATRVIRLRAFHSGGNAVSSSASAAYTNSAWETWKVHRVVGPNENLAELWVEGVLRVSVDNATNTAPAIDDVSFGGDENGATDQHGLSDDVRAFETDPDAPWQRRTWDRTWQRASWRRGW